MDEVEVVKCCNDIFSNCYYKMMNSAPPKCIYIGYCDHQLPRDSRMQPIYFPQIHTYTPGTDATQLLCICGGSACTDGKTCSICGKPKWR